MADPQQADTARRQNAYPPEFESVWRRYPRRQGDNPKREAYGAWRTRLKEGATADEIAAGVERYAAYVRKTGKEHTEFVKQAATFFGPNKAFLDEWQIAPKQATSLNCYEKPWFIDTWNTIVSKGAEKGIKESDFDTPPAFREAVLKAYGVTEEDVHRAEVA